MPTGQQYATNVPQTTLASGITAVATSFVVASSSNWPATPFTAVIDIGNSIQEPVDVTNVSGTTWTVTRAIDGTTAFAHATNATVTHADIGRDFREARTHMDATSGTNAHGLANSSFVVGTLDTQTLTNKSLTSPTITGTVAGGASYTTPTLDRPVLTDTTPSAPPANELALYVNSNTPSIFTPGGNTGSLIQAAADPTLNGMKVWTTNPDAVGFNNFTMVQTSGQSLWTRFNVFAPISVSNMWINLGGSGGGLTSGQNFAGIYNSSGTRVAQTADQTTAWGTSGNKQMALTGGPIALEPGVYYAVLLTNYSSTAPSMAMVNYSSGGPDMNIGFGGTAPGRVNKLTTTNTSLPASVTLSTLSLIPTELPFIGIS